MFKLLKKTIKDIENNFIKTDLPVLINVKIGVKIIEGTERVQFYEGTIIARKIVQLTLLLLSVK
jgi:ribosomal protein L19